MQKLLGFSDDYKNPEFASSYIFELRKDRESNFYVKVLFRNDKFNEGINYYPVVIKGNYLSVQFDFIGKSNNFFLI